MGVSVLKRAPALEMWWEKLEIRKMKRIVLSCRRKCSNGERDKILKYTWRFQIELWCRRELNFLNCVKQMKIKEM